MKSARFSVSLTVHSLVVVVGVLALGVPATAQVLTPTRGVFGGGANVKSAKELLALDVSVHEGYDSDVLLSPPVGFPSHVGGFSTFLSTGASYSRHGKAEVGATANSVLRYYSETGKVQSVGSRAGIGVTATTIGGLSLMANQSAAYSPASVYGLFPSSNPLQPGNSGFTSPNYTVSNFQSYTYTTSMSLGHGIGSHNSIAATGEYTYTDRVHETVAWGDVSSYSVSGLFSRKTTRNTNLSTELQYRSGEFAYRGAGKTTELALNVGVNYVRPVSATRSMNINVHTGVSRGDYPGASIGLNGTQRRYRVVGDGGFSIPLSYTWVATASIHRGLEYETSFPTPVVNNGATVGVTGLLTSRVDVTISAGVSRAESILNSTTLSINAYTGEANVRYALSRTLALTGGYLYYYYMMENGVLLLPGVPPGLKRNGVRVGFTLWAPALQR
jgi:hypothetical protein